MTYRTYRKDETFMILKNILCGLFKNNNKSKKNKTLTDTEKINYIYKFINKEILLSELPEFILDGYGYGEGDEHYPCLYKFMSCNYNENDFVFKYMLFLGNYLYFFSIIYIIFV